MSKSNGLSLRWSSWRLFFRAMRADMAIVVLPLLCSYLIAIVYLIEADSKILLRGCYALSVGVILLAVSSSRFRREIAPAYRRDWGAVLLGLFSIYLLFKALIYPDHDVSQNYLKVWILQVGIGSGLGFLVLSFFVCPEDKFLPRSVLILAYRTAITVGIITLSWISWRLYLRIEDGFFSIKSNTPSVYYYQIFGDYLFVQYCCLVILVRRAISFDSTIKTALCRNAVQLALTWWLFFLSQLVGSNNAALTIVSVGALTLIVDTIGYFRESTGQQRWLGSFSLSGEGIVSVAIAIAIAINLSPMRIFGYKPVPFFSMLQRPADTTLTTAPYSLSECGSFSKFCELVDVVDIGTSSRINILTTYGVAQLSVSPFFGDLGAEIIAGVPGGYLHSLLSVQTHLGLVGSLLLLGFLASRIMCFITRRNAAVIVAFIAVTFVTASLATFFSWMPFWFAIGFLLAMPTQEQRVAVI